MEEKLGFKEITIANWNKPDKVTLRFGPRKNTSEEHPLLLQILSPKLRQDVPLEIRKLFEVARGAMVYSYYSYPLYTLGLEQLFRVGEATLLFKCKSLGYRKKKSTFTGLIAFLAQKQVLDSTTAKKWDALRYLRNSASHPDQQSIYPPGAAITFVESLAAEISALCPFQNGGIA